MSVVMSIEAAGNRVGGALCRVPGPGRWLGGVTVAAASLVAGVVAALRGLITRPRHLPVAVAGGLLVVAGKAVALGQAAAGLQWRQRALTAEEHALLTAVFGDSVDLRAVRVVTGFAGVFSATPRPFTLGATLYLKDDVTPATLVHECAHVWQYQHLGCRYTADALWAQYRIKPSAYRWVHELGRGRQHWREFNLEAQAQFLEDIVHCGPQFFGDGKSWFTHRGVDYTDLAHATLAEVRAARTRRLRAPGPR
jgi:hypothetical protein